MPIELPNLDDKTYAELVREAQASIPGIYPGWTDHNPSDPGIALVELFAWLTELVIYRAGRIPDESVRTFLRILDGQTTAPSAQAPLEEAIRSTMRALRERFRAVTAEDYEYLARYAWPSWALEHAEELALSQITLIPAEIPPKRVRCLAERNLLATEPNDPDGAAPGHMSLVVVPGAGTGDSPWLSPSNNLCGALGHFFDKRRLITTRVHITGPTYVGIKITATLRLRGDVRKDDFGERAQDALVQHFHPWTGGREGNGWPFGRDVHVSEIYALLDGVPGVESVVSATLEALDDPAGRSEMEGPIVVAIRLKPYELPEIRDDDLQLMDITPIEAPAAGWEDVP